MFESFVVGVIVCGAAFGLFRISMRKRARAQKHEHCGGCGNCGSVKER